MSGRGGAGRGGRRLARAGRAAVEGRAQAHLQPAHPGAPTPPAPTSPHPAAPDAVILFAMGFQSRGFNWCQVALFSAMVASTDALSVTAILKKSERGVGLGMVAQGWRQLHAG